MAGLLGGGGGRGLEAIAEGEHHGRKEHGRQHHRRTHHDAARRRAAQPQHRQQGGDHRDDQAAQQKNAHPAQAIDQKSAKVAHAGHDAEKKRLDRRHAVPVHQPRRMPEQQRQRQVQQHRQPHGPLEGRALRDLLGQWRAAQIDLGKLPTVHQGRQPHHGQKTVGLTMFLIQNKPYIDKLNSISIFACQAYGAVLNPLSYAKILAAKIVTKLFGYMPAKNLGLGPINESYYTMTQWYDWNLQKNFISGFIRNRDIDKQAQYQNARFDYRQHMPAITTPIYAISGKGDLFISPTRGCQLFFEGFGHPDNVFREYAKSTGHLEDYDHTRVLMSRNSSKEIWPTVATWIEKYST